MAITGSARTVTGASSQIRAASSRIVGGEVRQRAGVARWEPAIADLAFTIHNSHVRIYDCEESASGAAR